MQVKPDELTYAVVIKAYGKLGLWQKALELKAQMTNKRAHLHLYNSLLITLSYSCQLAPALELKAEMELIGVKLNQLSYSALIQNVCKVSCLLVSSFPTASLALIMRYTSSPPSPLPPPLPVILHTPVLSCHPLLFASIQFLHSIV